MLYKSGPNGPIREPYASQHGRTYAGWHQTNQCNPANKNRMSFRRARV